MLCGALAMALAACFEPAASGSPKPEATGIPQATAPAVKTFRDTGLQLSFDYPASWGDVRVTRAEPGQLAAGERYAISFTGLPSAGAALQSRDAKPAYGRGGAYWDPPHLFSEVVGIKDQPWDVNRQEAVAVTDRSDSYLATAWCSSLLNFVGVLGWARLGSGRFDAILFYERLREGGTGGVDTTGCADPAALMAPLRPEFAAVVRSARPT